MKKLYIVLFALVLGISFSTKAHDFLAVNSDGDTIYYYINSTGQYKVSVTFKGSTNLSYSEPGLLFKLVYHVNAPDIS